MRKTIEVRISDPGRDKDKMFLIEEMSAYEAEKWAWKVGMALGSAGVDVGEVSGMSFQQLAAIGLNALFHINSEESWALGEQLMSCVYMLPNPSNLEIRRRLTIDDIEEPRTRLHLKWEVFKLHTGFSLGGGPSTSISETSRNDASNTQTSPLPSGRSSPRAKRGFPTANLATA